MTLVELLVAVAILSGGSILILQSLATVSHALTVAENTAGIHPFAVNKMAERHLDVRRNRQLGEGEQGRFQMGKQSFEWEMVPQAVPEDPAVGAVTLTVRWRQGWRRYEENYRTLIWIPIEKEKE